VAVVSHLEVQRRELLAQASFDLVGRHARQHIDPGRACPCLQRDSVRGSP
jgi:hypothetical protein